MQLEDLGQACRGNGETSSSILNHSEDFGSSEGNGGEGFLEEAASQMMIKGRDGERGLCWWKELYELRLRSVPGGPEMGS